ncbi:hypothetical protein PoB_001381400 [Plakobranchus ocellatus]|uniref:Uncharacterized protein n=1 Tax=Plakobranchus ocellatus TaxID=259542 RepID=A0AAV3YZV1_9GAST|nr:hypothetical protein PoB_001381400 [Plakobranchus ocellatus]
MEMMLDRRKSFTHSCPTLTTSRTCALAAPALHQAQVLQTLAAVADEYRCDITGFGRIATTPEGHENA